MATTLEVVNDCLATMGESPLNTLAEPHEFKGAAQRLLSRKSREIQSVGWWFNLEAITLKPAEFTGYVQLPTDALRWESGVRSSDTLVQSQSKPWLVQRGQRLYDTRTRSYGITESVTGELVREVPFEEMPLVVNEYVAAAAVLQFQSSYDGDTQRRAELTQRLLMLRGEARAENIRQLRVNLISANSSIGYLKTITRGARRNRW